MHERVCMKRREDVKVLVVDDEPVLREMIASEFQMRGFETVEAGSGRDGLELVRRQHIDVVVSDIRMPNGDGVSLLKGIKALDDNQTAVFLMSGYSDYSLEQIKALGAEELFPKPCRLDHIIDTVERYLQIAP